MLNPKFKEGDYVWALISTVSHVEYTRVPSIVISESGITGLYYVVSLDGELSYLKHEADLILMSIEEAALMLFEK